VAATAVVVSHVRYDFVHNFSLPERLPAHLDCGEAGVDLFFVISGFVMVYSSERLFGRINAPIAFLARRIARIVPLYWIMTGVMLVYVVARGFAPSDASPMLALASFFFVPYPRPSGGIDPLYGVGWTLNYEMFFYVVFALALMTRRGVAVAGIAVLFVILALFAPAAHFLPRQVVYLGNPIILEFVLGMAVALIYRAGIRLPPLAALLLAALAITEFSYCVWFRHVDLPRWIGYGVPAAQTVAAFALIKGTVTFRAVEKLGDASYALYLIHPAIISLARALSNKGYLNPGAEPWLYLAGVTIISICASLIVHRFLEKPTTERCRRVLLSALSQPPPRRAVQLDPTGPG
jgi:exopolysaccharide production protein ExoZ